MKGKLFRKLALISITALALGGCAKTRQELPGNPHEHPKVMRIIRRAKRHAETNPRLYQNAQDKAVKLTTKQEKFAEPWAYTPQREFKMLSLDWRQRALGSHIQVKRSQLPQYKRDPRIYVNPSGWHNYKFTTQKNGKSYVTWLFNRGHLVGYQFCGVNDEPRNLVTETAYLNQGGLDGMDDSNPKAMLFYENNLRQWVNTHPQDKLDYAVIPLYHGLELVPRQIRLTFVGVKPSDKQVKIQMPGVKLKTHGKVSEVILNNSSPRAKINYATGRATITK